MKTQLIILAVGALLMSSGSVFAGQDFWQRVQIERAMAGKQKAAVELARRQTPDSTSVAGAKGEAGRIGPNGTNPSDPSYGCAHRNQRLGTCDNFK